jgi:hypothetical protein
MPNNSFYKIDEKVDNMQFKAGYIVDTIAKVVTDFKATLDNHKLDDQKQLDQIKWFTSICKFF